MLMTSEEDTAGKDSCFLLLIDVGDSSFLLLWVTVALLLWVTVAFSVDVGGSSFVCCCMVTVALLLLGVTVAFSVDVGDISFVCCCR